MASSLLKKVRTRVARCSDQLLQLRAECATAEDAQRLEQCIAVIRDATGRMDDVFHDYQPAVAPPRQRVHVSPLAAPSTPTPPPVYGRETGITEAQPQQSKNWAFNDIVGGVGSDDDIVMLPSNMTDAEFVKHCLEKHTTASQIDAAEALAAMPGWPHLSDAAKASAIRRVSAEMEQDDDFVDDSKPLVARPESLRELVPPFDPANITF